eukprot:7391156-Prymnesium_polylepis.1
MLPVMAITQTCPAALLGCSRHMLARVAGITACTAIKGRPALRKRAVCTPPATPRGPASNEGTGSSELIPARPYRASRRNGVVVLLWRLIASIAARSSAATELEGSGAFDVFGDPNGVECRQAAPAAHCGLEHNRSHNAPRMPADMLERA